MKRRQFIRSMSALSMPLGLGLPGLSLQNILPILENPSDKILIIIQLIGGYDGLSTFVPIDQMDSLYPLRSNIMPEEKNYLKVSEENAFHPALNGFYQLFQEGQMSVIQNVGYPLQNRSHFRSLDIWNTGSGSSDYLDSGWMGRYADIIQSTELDYPWAISLGKNVSETCQGQSKNHAISLVDPSSPIELPYGELTDSHILSFSENLEFIHNTILDNNKYGKVLETAFEKGNSLSNRYPEDNTLAQQFKTIAQLISGGLPTPVYTVSLGGFDTHANQVSGADKVSGTLPNLLRTLGDAIHAFWDDLNQLGLEKRVLGMTYSEFGRKIISNASLGTDHGDAAPMFVFGDCLQQPIIGSNPIISKEVSPRDGIPFQIDYRNVYGSILEDWFDFDRTNIQNIFTNHSYENLNITQSCDTLSNSNILPNDLSIRIFPQPVNRQLQIQINRVPKGELHLTLVDLQGKEIKKWKYTIHHGSDFYQVLPIPRLATGLYLLQVQHPQIQKTQKLIVQQ